MISQNVEAQGIYKFTVKNKQGEVVQETDWLKNMVCYFALTAKHNILSSSVNRNVRLYSHAGTPFANKETLAGTFEQTGNTLTRSSGSVDFTDGTFRIGDNIKFASGERALIQSIDSATELTIFESQSVAAGTVTHYRTGLDTGDSTALAETQEGLFGLTNYTFSATSAGVYDREVDGTSGEFTTSFIIKVVWLNNESRIVLDTPINIAPGNTLSISYRYRYSFSEPTQSTVTNTWCTGWPFTQGITNLVADGSKFTLTVDNVSAGMPDGHRFEAGEEITITGAHPVFQVASAITSDGTDWTLTVTGHPFSVSDSVVIDSASGNYDGTYTVDSVPDANTITISNAANHPSSSGQVRFATPASYFNGTHTVANVPDAQTIEVTSALPALTLPSNVGNFSAPNQNHQLNFVGYDWGTARISFEQILYSESETLTSFGDLSTSSAPSTSGFSSIPFSKPISDNSSTIANGFTTNYQYKTSTNESNDFRIKQLYFRLSNAQRTNAILTFDHRQRKPNTQEITINLAFTFSQELN